MSGPRGSGCGSTKRRPHFPLLPGGPTSALFCSSETLLFGRPSGEGEEGANPMEQGVHLLRSWEGHLRVLSRLLSEIPSVVLHRDGGWEGIKFPQRLFPGESGLGKPAPGTQGT